MAGSRSKEAMLKALVELLLEKPLDKITVTEVVARAGVSRVTYYRRYYSLHEVIDEALDEIFSKVEGIVPMPAPGGTPVSRRSIELSTYQALVLYRESQDLLRPLLLGHLSSEVIGRIFELVLRLTPIDSLLSRHTAGPPTLTDERVAAMNRTYIAAGMTAVMTEWIKGGCETPVEDVLEFILAVSPGG